MEAFQLQYGTFECRYRQIRYSGLALRPNNDVVELLRTRSVRSFFHIPILLPTTRSTPLSIGSLFQFFFWQSKQTTTTMTISIDNLMSYVAIVLDLIHNQQWTKLETITSQHKLFRIISEFIQKCDEFNGMTLLHAVVKNKPPLHILDAMIYAHSDALKGQDCVGRTPLHVACGTGADAQIVRCLVKAFPQACDLQDEDGRLPLHLACDTDCVLFEGDEAPRAPPTVGVVKALLAGSLRSVLVEDDDDMSPIEYAIISDANIDVVKLLQKASMPTRREEAKTSKADASSTAKDVCQPIVPLPRSVLGYCS